MQNLSVRARDDAASADSLITAGVLIWNDVTDDGRSAFYEWHDREHMPERMSIPGFVRARRYASFGASPQWFTLYEAASLDVLVSSAYLERLNNPTRATQETLQFFRNTARSVCRVERAAGDAIGGQAVVIRLDRKADGDLGAAQKMAMDLIAKIEGELPGVIRTTLFGADSSASRIDTAESRTREFDVPQLTLMIETTHLEGAELARSVVLAADWLQYGLAPRQEHATYQLEICIS